MAQAPDGPSLPAKMDGVNPEIMKLVGEDQWDRGEDMFGHRKGIADDKIDWAAVTTRDGERHRAVRKLLADGKLESGKDYEFAALIFQHSYMVADLMMAHTLAVTAIAKGDREARWLAAATFDRYLGSLQQPQVFGTQFHQENGGPWTMDPYDRTALSDAVRASWCVTPLAEQEKTLKNLQNGQGSASTGLRNCK